MYRLTSSVVDSAVPTSIAEFHDAVFRGDLEAAAKMADADPSLPTSYNADRFGASAMVEAARGGHCAAVDFLIERGVSPNHGSDWWAGSFSPLITAVHQRDPVMAEHLVSRGATVTAYEAAAMGDTVRLGAIVSADPHEVHIRGGDGQQPLHVAATPEVAAYLLDHGANIEARCVDHESTPLQYANERPAVAQLLLERGAEGDIFAFAVVPDTRWLADALAAEPSLATQPFLRSDFPCSEGIVNMYAFNIGDNAQPVHAAVMRANEAGTRMLVAYGADLGARGGYDDATPLHFAAWNNSADIIPVLAELGADLDAPSGPAHKNSPLGWAIVGGSLEAVRALLAVGASVWSNHREEAEAGAEGHFQSYKRVPMEDRLAIAAAVRTIQA